MSTHARSAALNDVINRAQKLSPEEQEQLLDELESLIHPRSSRNKEAVHSLLELEGLGAEVWKGIDPQKYLEEERRSWRG